MSSIFLSFGPTSGLLTGHILNNLVECLDIAPVWYTESSIGLTPNAVFYDNGGSVRLFQDFKEDLDELQRSSGRKIEKIESNDVEAVSFPKFKPTPFIEYVLNGGKTIIPLNEPRPNFKLEDVSVKWCDIVNFNLSRRNYVEIPGTDVEPMKTFNDGFEKAGDSENYEIYTDPIRRTLETCDRIGAFISFVDRNEGFGGFFDKTVEYLIEEAPKAVRMTYSMGETVVDDAHACNASLSLASSLAHSSLHTVLLPPTTLPSIVDSTRYRADNLYSQTALLSLPVLSSLLPILHGKVTPRFYVDTIAPSSILRFPTLNANFPYFHDMSLFGFEATEQIFSRLTVVNGVGGDKRSEMYAKYKPESPFFYEGVGQDSPVFVGFTMPHFFKDGVLTADSQQPTVKPQGLPDEQFEKLVKLGVIKMKEGVDCDLIRFLSSASTYSTSKSVVEPLKNSIDFIKSAPHVTRDIHTVDAEARLEVIMDIIDGLENAV